MSSQKISFSKNRLEAFSDGVFAIIITIMVLELKVPHGETVDLLIALLPTFLSYVLSFIYLGIYWNNHHHLLHATHHVGGGVMWANLHLLFWLSLLPFVTGWAGENHFAFLPVFAYGVVMLGSAFSYWLLQQTIIRHQGEGSVLAKAVGRDYKGKLSLFLYLSSLGLVFISPAIALAIYIVVALLWLIPDTRIEKVLL